MGGERCPADHWGMPTYNNLINNFSFWMRTTPDEMLDQGIIVSHLSSRLSSSDGFQSTNDSFWARLFWNAKSASLWLTIMVLQLLSPPQPVEVLDQGSWVPNFLRPRASSWWPKCRKLVMLVRMRVAGRGGIMILQTGKVQHRHRSYPTEKCKP